MDLKTSWNLLWTWSRPQIDLRLLFFFQKINHFLGSKELARKDLLKKNIERIKKLGNKARSSFDIIPETYFLPGENMQFIKKFREYSLEASLNYWIMKPVGLSRGRGIELVTRIEDIAFNEPVVVQKYLDNPLLLEGHKFDMRIYVVVLSINPLEAFVYREGFARISTEKYSLDREDLGNKFIHLTNFSVQK
jgi:tubulin polyglutamylase TTLL5